MRKNKYRFNSKTLSYEKDNRNFYNKILRSFIPKFILSTVIGILLFYVFTSFVISTENFFLSDNSNDLKLKYELLDKELDYTVKALETLQHRDDDVYRMIFQAEPISASKRKAGFGGSDRYIEFRNYENSGLLINTSQKTDILSKIK